MTRGLGQASLLERSVRKGGKEKNFLGLPEKMAGMREKTEERKGSWESPLIRLIMHTRKERREPRAKPFFGL